MLNKSDFALGALLIGQILAMMLVAYAIHRVRGPGRWLDSGEFALEIDSEVVCLTLLTSRRFGVFYPPPPVTRAGNSDWAARRATIEEAELYRSYADSMRGWVS